jgi:hypothetical protein
MLEAGALCDRLARDQIFEHLLQGRPV